MKRQTKIAVLLIFTIVAMVCVSCGISKIPIGKNYIRIDEPARKENFTNEQLRNYIKKNESPAIVVRSFSASNSISSNSSSSSDRLCSLLELGLAKNNFDIRDRALFESVATSEQTSKSYEDIYAATHVDLLMEIVSYSVNDLYMVSGYYDQFGKYQKFEPVNEGNSKAPNWIFPKYTFRGMSLNIKVTLLKDNVVGGSYSYSYVPCSAESGGAEIVQMYPLRYRPAAESRDIDAILDGGIRDGLIQSTNDRLDKAMEDFITNVVVPEMMADMKGLERPETVRQSSVAELSPEEQLQRDVKEIKERYSRFEIEQLARIGAFMPNQWPYAYSHEAFVEAAGSFKKEKERQKPDNSQNSQDLQQGTAMLSEVKAVNSYGRISEAIASVISSKFKSQREEESASGKKKKTSADYATVYDKFNYLNWKNMPDIGKFVSSTCSSAGLNVPKDAGEIVLFMPAAAKPSLYDSVIYIFIDDDCVGAGTLNKGFYASLEESAADTGFHNLVIVGVHEKQPVRTVLYSSTVQFEIKGTYIFSPKLSGAFLKELSLN